MPTFPNGQIPRDRLVFLGSGTNGDGYWEHLLPPTTAAKHRALVRRGEQISGRTLRITTGWNGYRPLHIQVEAKRKYGGGAAAPGFSSHGGDWAGAPTGWRRVDTAAIDYANWAEVFGSFERFRQEAAAVGLLVGAVMPPDWPYEPWHVIDLDPWGAIPAGVQGGFLMALNDQQQAELLNMVANIYHGLYTGGPSTPNGEPIATVIGRIDANVAPILRPVGGSNQLISLRQEVADAKSMLLELVGRPVSEVNVDLDEAAIADKLAPLLVANLGSLSDETIERVAQASANELRERLGQTPPDKTQ